MKIPRKLSPGEETFALHCKAYNLSPEREFAFHPTRQFRFDFAFLDQKIAVEIEGVTVKGGRHQRKDGFSNDCVKYNASTMLGWKLLRYTTAMVTSGEAINDVLGMLGKSGGPV